jgi:hypothetical protein
MHTNFILDELELVVKLQTISRPQIKNTKKQQEYRDANNAKD